MNRSPAGLRAGGQKEVIPIAEKRMFSQKIVGSDEFMDMPLSAQALYFHLNMRADDDGFINNTARVLRDIKAKPKDLRVLIEKRFLISFDNGVIVIKHWRMHNTLRKDRYTPTYYQDHLKALIIKENGAYTEREKAPVSSGQMATGWQPDGNQMATAWQPAGNQASTTMATNWQPDGNQMATTWQPSIDKIREGLMYEERSARAHAREEPVPFGEEVTDEDITQSFALDQLIDDLAFKWGLPRDPGNLMQARNIYHDFEDCPPEWFSLAVEYAGKKDATKNWAYVRGILNKAKQRGDINSSERSGKTGTQPCAEQTARAELEELGIAVPFL